MVNPSHLKHYWYNEAQHKAYEYSIDKRENALSSTLDLLIYQPTYRFDFAHKDFFFLWQSLTREKQILALEYPFSNQISLILPLIGIK